MAKFVGTYTETFARNFIIEADSEEEAQEKLEYAAEYIGGLVNLDYFDHWNTQIRKAKEKDVMLYDKLPEE